MGKTKHEKKFDRNVEISAPYLDPEIIRQIHSPPKDQKRDIRHGGFKALLSDFNSQDSADELTPITENHLPSYIGISCAVSGYSNYSSYSRKPSEELKTHEKLVPSGTRQVTNRSQTNSPLATRIDQQNIHHVTIDKTNISSPDQERKELTEKLTASVAERRRSPSPLPPTEDDRHHGAYVGARYFPMPEPSKLVHKHIPLLGIDDDVDPDTVVVEDVNKVEKKIASLYGDEFVEDWKESMSHKSKKELEGIPQQDQETKSANLKEIVNLKPTPPKTPHSDEPKLIDVPTPNVKVLANVEKQFLTRLLTDENPPMPKSPSPQPLSTTISKSKTESVQRQEISVDKDHDSHPAQVTDVSNDRLQSPLTPDPNIESSSEALDAMVDEGQPSNSDLAQIEAISAEQQQGQNEFVDEVSSEHDEPVDLEVAHEAMTTDNEVHITANNESSRSRSSSSSSRSVSRSPESQVSSSTVERAPFDSQRQQELGHDEEHIEYEIRAESPQVNNESSPVKVLERTDDVSPLTSIEETSTQETGNLLSFSPEPSLDKASEANNNFEDRLVQSADCIQPSVDDLVQVDESTPTQEEPERSAEILATELDQVVDLNDEVKDGHYFLDLLKREESFIMDKVRFAEQLLEEHQSEMDEERLGRIHSAIGKANLLINKKCNQFKELCEKSINGNASDQYAVLNDDLAGFWDMISIQIIDVRKSFENL